MRARAALAALSGANDWHHLRRATRPTTRTNGRGRRHRARIRLMAPVSAVHDHCAIGTKKRDRHLRACCAGVGPFLHEQLAALAAHHDRVAGPHVSADIRRKIRLRAERGRRRQRLHQPAMRDGLIRRVTETEIRLERLPLDVLNDAPASIRIGQDGDGEVAFRRRSRAAGCVRPSVPPCDAVRTPPIVRRCQPMPMSSSVLCLRNCGARNSSSDSRRNIRSCACRAIAEMKARVGQQVGNAQRRCRRRSRWSRAKTVG